MKKERIWEIDALRGFLIICMIIVHFAIGAQMFFPQFTLPAWLEAVMMRAGTLFVIVSGLSATLGTRTVRRGIIVFCCGLALQLGSYLAVLLGIFGDEMVIRFGVLHLLGISMMLWPLIKAAKPWQLLIAAAVIIGLGYWFETFYVKPKFLFAFGLITRQFGSGDFYPLFPEFGWFLVGGALGKLLYAEKKTLLPKVKSDCAILRFFRFCGRNSLIIYLVHLPLVGGILMLVSLLLQG